MMGTLCSEFASTSEAEHGFFSLSFSVAGSILNRAFWEKATCLSSPHDSLSLPTSLAFFPLRFSMHLRCSLKRPCDFHSSFFSPFPIAFPTFIFLIWWLDKFARFIKKKKKEKERESYV